MNLFIVCFIYDIMFRDSDEGDCHAGEAKFNLAVFDDEVKAQTYVDSLQNTLKLVSSKRVPNTQNLPQIEQDKYWCLEDKNQQGSENHKLVIESMSLNQIEFKRGA